MYKDQGRRVRALPAAELEPKSWDNAAVKLFFQRSAYDGEGRQTDPSLKGGEVGYANP